MKNTHKDKDGNLISPAPSVAPISAATATLVGEESYMDDSVSSYSSMSSMGMNSNHGSSFSGYHDSGPNHHGENLILGPFGPSFLLLMSVFSI